MVTAIADERIVNAVRRAHADLAIRVRVDRPVTGVYLCELGTEFEPYAFEAGNEREIIITAPPGWPSARIEHLLAGQLLVWELAASIGESNGANWGYDPPGGRPRIPDASWISDETKAKFERAGRPGASTGFAQITPDFVIEVRSRSQMVAEQQEKMEDWRDWGVALGLLVDPESQTVYIYRPGQPVALLERPQTVSCEPEMPGLDLDFTEIWTLPWP